MQRNNISPVGVEVLGPNVKMLAQAMGANYAKAELVSDIANLLEPLNSMQNSLLIEYVTNIDA